MSSNYAIKYKDSTDTLSSASASTVYLAQVRAHSYPEIVVVVPRFHCGEVFRLLVSLKHLTVKPESRSLL